MANFTGSWDGPSISETKLGIFKSSGFIIFNQTNETFSIEGCGFIITPDIILSCSWMSYEIKNQELWAGSEKVGQISEDHFQINIKDATWTQSWSGDRDNDQMNYLYEARSENDGNIIIHGNLVTNTRP